MGSDDRAQLTGSDANRVNLSQDLQIALTVAVSEASRRRHEYALPEHVLYALTLADEAAEILRNTGADPDRIRQRLDLYFEQELDPFGHRGEPRLSLGVQRILARAGAQVEGSGKDEVRAADLLVALYTEADSYAVQVLEAEGLQRLDVVSYLSHGVARNLSGAGARRGVGEGPVPAGEPGDEMEGEAPRRPADALEAFTQDLTDMARRGRLDPLVGRETEIRRTLHVLQRRRKNNPLFVGDPGVGKTALAEGLAVKIAREEVPARFRDARIFRLDLGALLAGTRYRGDFENRMKAVLAALEEQSGETMRPILFLDEIHTLVGAGSAGRGTLDASNLLKPALQDGWLRMIGATTWEELRQSFERDKALARRFQKIEIAEPSTEETVRIFLGLQDRYQAHHGVSYTRPAVETAAELAGRYLRDRRLPDSALDLLDEAGAAVALAPRRGGDGDGGRVGTADVERILSTMARIPEQRVRGDETSRLQRLETELKARVFGQDEALERLAAAVRVARAGLRAPDQPVGSFLLTGPTGVGKTETARELARILDVHFFRYDMSEYMERHSVSRLVGAPPGYVGYDRGGLLTEAVSQHPHAVLLLDEIEKAHEDVFNILLQVMDHGTLTDTNGKATDFRHVIVLMTSNVGAREMARRALGFADDAEGRRLAEGDRAVEQTFSPEFRNRLDGVLHFAPLTPEVMERIVAKLFAELTGQLAARGVTVEMTDAASKKLAEMGHDPVLGARPLARVIDEHVKQPLTEDLLFGELTGGGHAVVDVSDGEIVVETKTL